MEQELSIDFIECIVRVDCPCGGEGTADLGFDDYIYCGRCGKRYKVDIKATVKEVESTEGEV